MDIQLGYWRWKLFRWNDHPNPFRNRPADALNWLLQFQGNAAVMSELSNLLLTTGTGAYSTTEPNLILQQLADKMSSGEIFTCVELCGPVRVESDAATEEAEPDLTQVAPPPAAPAPAPDPEPEPEPTLASNTDPVAMAQALKNAAEKGTPFCQQCQKAPPAPDSPASSSGQSAKARAAASAPADADSDVDVDPANAQVLREAAVDGVPFCQECERLRAAQAASQPELVTQ